MSTGGWVTSQKSLLHRCSAHCTIGIVLLVFIASVQRPATRSLHYHTGPFVDHAGRMIKNSACRKLDETWNVYLTVSCALASNIKAKKRFGWNKRVSRSPHNALR
jgi:hypothetical protein